MAKLRVRLPSPPADLQPLLDALLMPADCEGYGAGRWDCVIALARSARLLGVLAHRIDNALDVTRLDDGVRRHLQAGVLEARFRRQKTLYLLQTIAPLLAVHGGPKVLLKGAAYIAQDLPLAQGRLPSDVDLLVPKTALDAIEQSLLSAGWEFEKTDPYDQHYYRAWSHELPPMQAAGQVLELDLHHDILPPIGRIRPDTEALFTRSIALDQGAYRVLDPLDQVLHAVVHLVHDSDCVGRLRDLVDIDSLMRALPLDQEHVRQALVERARQHGMARPLYAATALAEGWFGTPGTGALMRELDAAAPGASSARWVASLASRVLGPPPLDGRPRPGARGAKLVLQARAQWLRMPPWLLAYHATRKGLRRFARTPESAATTTN